MSLRTVNLNLVPVLLALLRERSVSNAAVLLGLSQGATSNALSRLRATFNDPLLVRVGTHMELTPRAVELIAPAEELCGSLETFFSRSQFDPAKAKRTFVVGTGDYSTFVIAAPLLAAVARVAPDVRLRFVDVLDSLSERMAEREIDVAIVPESFINHLAPARFSIAPLVEETSVVVFRDGHPLAELTTITEKDIAPYRTIAFHPGSDVIERKDQTAFTGGYPIDVMAYVPQVTIAPFLVLDTDYVTIVPSRIAARMAAILPIQIRPLAFGSQQFHIVVAWSPVHDADPAHIWFRNIVHQASVPPIAPVP